MYSMQNLLDSNEEIPLNQETTLSKCKFQKEFMKSFEMHQIIYKIANSFRNISTSHLSPSLTSLEPAPAPTSNEQKLQPPFFKLARTLASKVG